MARWGSFQGPTTPYGLPTNVVHPEDNDITPDPNKAEADALQAQVDDLHDDLINAQRAQNRQP